MSNILELKKENLEKPSILVSMTNKLTYYQHNIFNCLLFVAQKQLEKIDNEKRVFSINIENIEELTSVSIKNNYSFLKTQLKEIAKKSVELDILKKNKDKEWRFINLIVEPAIKNNKVSFELSRTLREILLSEYMYVNLSFYLIKKLENKYSLTLYEILYDWYRGKYTEKNIKLKELREILDIKDKYNRPSDFNKYIIKKAVNEINKKTDIIVNYEYIKKSKKIVGYKFKISRNEKNIKNLDKDKILLKTLLDEIELRYNEKTLNTIFKITTDMKIISIACNKYKKKKDRSNIKNQTGYFIGILKNTVKKNKDNYFDNKLDQIEYLFDNNNINYVKNDIYTFLGYEYKDIKYMVKKVKKSNNVENEIALLHYFLKKKDDIIKQDEIKNRETRKLKEKNKNQEDMSKLMKKMGIDPTNLINKVD